MKVGIYSDLHLSKNDVKISETHTHNVFDSIKWAKDTFKQEKCELVIDCGDMLDSDVIESEANRMISQIYANNAKDIKEIILCGNHEMKDALGHYNSLCMLNNYPNVEVIDNLKVMEITKDLTFVFQPYTNKEESIDKLVDTLDKIKGKKVLFSHLTYTNVPNVKLNDKIKGEITYPVVRDKVDLIFNGHIHIGLESEKYYQVGTLTGLSFNDDYRFHKPGIIIFDTDTFEVKRIDNPLAVLYVKTSFDKLNVKELDRTYLRIDCPTDKVEETKKKIEKLGIKKYKLQILTSDTNDEVENEKTDFNIYSSPAEALYDFVKKEKGIYTEKQLNTFINEYIENLKVGSQE